MTNQVKEKNLADRISKFMRQILHQGLLMNFHLIPKYFPRQVIPTPNFSQLSPYTDKTEICFTEGTFTSRACLSMSI